MRTNLNFAAGSAFVLTLVTISTASAHVCLDVPTSRAADMCKTHELLEAARNTEQKVGPCGSSKGRMVSPTVYKPGETITVKWTETIDHQPSWYRISFNPDGETFEDPTSYDDNTGKHPNTLKDGIQDDAAAVQEIEVTLPNILCDKCVLQLIQVMGDKGGNGFGGNDGPAGQDDNDDLYYACADIILRGDAPTADAGTNVDAGLGSAIDPSVTRDASVSNDAGGSAAPGARAGSSGGGATGATGTDGGASGTGGVASIETLGGGGTAGASITRAGSPSGSGVPSSEGTLGSGQPSDKGTGCAVALGRTCSTSGAVGAAIVMLALSYRRRRRG